MKPDIALHWIRQAAGPTLVMIGTLGTDARIWSRLAHSEALAGRQICTVELPGHGSSAQPRVGYTVAELAASVIGALNVEIKDDYAFCGVGLGASVSLVATAAAPERISGLVMASVALTMPLAAWSNRAREVLEAGSTNFIVEATLSRWVTERFQTDEAAQLSELRSMLREVSAVAYAEGCGATAGMDIRRHLTSIGIPFLILSGADDIATTPASQFRATVHGLSQQVVIGNAAHLVPFEQPTEVAAHLALYLNARNNQRS